MISSFMAAGLTVSALAYMLIKRLNTGPSLSRVRGPKPSSFMLGNLLELFQHWVGQADFEWQSLYGDVVRFKTVFGGDQLLVADPKALHRIFNTAAYRYPKQPNLRVISRMLNGTGVIWADGEDHKRQRRILLPGFGGPESKAFLAVFKECAESMCMKWTEIIGNSTEQNVVLNIPSWLSRGTLDAIGQAPFDVQLGTIQDDEHPLARKYSNMISDIFGRPSAKQIFIQAASKYIPVWTLEWMTDNLENPRLERARDVKRLATEVAKQLVRDKAETLLTGKESRDIFSLLVKANMDTDAKNKLTEEELLSQMRTILFAGHETTSNTLSWILLELARHPKVQSKLRAEIHAMEVAIRARGDTQFTVTDFDEMSYMTAVIKEGLRYHPVVPHVQRMAGRDDILPLARPIATESGEAINEIVVPKGTRIVVSIAAYNRNKDLWGEDAHEFDPDRWLNGVANEKKPVSIGVYSNLMTFSGGPRGCLGWRFAVLEVQAFLVEIISRFKLTMTDQSKKVSRGPGLFMVPVVDGEIKCNSLLPLAVSVAGREDDG